jgi:hypothetical protein
MMIEVRSPLAFQIEIQCFQGWTCFDILYFNTLTNAAFKIFSEPPTPEIWNGVVFADRVWPLSFFVEA